MSFIVDSSMAKPIKIWARDLWWPSAMMAEDGALQQARNVASLPFTFSHVAIMADGHQGYGMPIGGVLATRGVVVPNAVGVDIGCGMCASRTNLMHLDIAARKEIMTRVRKTVPVGFEHRDEAIPGMPLPPPSVEGSESIVEREYERATKQLGTLGGGNHFIELQQGSDGYVWIMVHSGSRNLGLQVAKAHNVVAQKLNQRWHSQVPAEWDLAFLPVDTAEAQAYLADMQYCVDFARANRDAIIDRVAMAIVDVVGGTDFDSPIDVAHNYAAMEHHFGENVFVHRKGAVHAPKDKRGIIPGSQGTASYITRGLGHPQSFNSCSHGAGRRMGRKAATRNLDLLTEQQRLDDLGVVHSVRTIADLDEAPGAYKDIDEVMAAQDDLVAIEIKLTPLAVVKG